MPDDNSIEGQRIGTTLALINRDLKHIIDLNTKEYETLRKLNEAIYGNEDRPGLATRLSVLEGRIQMIWSAIGAIGAASVVALVNALVNLFRAHG